MARKLPLCPSWAPTLRALLDLEEREPRPGPSLDGGLDEVRELSLTWLFEHQQPRPHLLHQDPPLAHDRVARLDRHRQGRLLGQEGGRGLHSEKFSGKPGGFCCGYKGGLNSYLRMLLAALGYVLNERLCALALQGTALATAQVDTLRIKLLKVGAVVTRNTRRIRLYMASNWPSAQTFAHAMSQLRSP